MTRAGGGLIVVAIALVVWSQQSSGLPMYDFEIVAKFPHDDGAYSQGLLYHDGALLESTGRYGTSSVRRVELETGRELLRSDLPTTLFGEGIALLGERLYQLTWTAGIARVYTPADFVLLDQITYEGEGWGLTTDGRHLIRSDGTDLLRFHDPVSFEEVRRIRVHVGEQPVESLNELEWVDGEIWANIWKADYIARIDPQDGEVLGYIDLTGLFDYAALPDAESVLNGIAYDAAEKRIFVTGKLWPALFEIEISRR
jgi:glutamine cyclotransferase